ncbi:carbohydrate binding domain-containing protein [Streptomyces anulatus]|uniref:carbohydrate binding domain-containing protein n=1 Tax=Streptomyces anulatus TaxID=1892 RepID=UPI0036956D84
MAAFPLDIRTELQIGGVWTDVTADVRTSDPMTITRGAGDEASALEPSTCEFRLNNRHGRYSPRNPMSPGLIGRNTPVRVSVPGPESYLQVDGSAASWASTPDTAALDITGDLDLRIEATCDWGAAQGQALIGKWNSGTNQRSYLLRIGAGNVYLNWSVAGTASVFGQRPLPELPRRAALRATMDVSNGSGGFTITFYWAPTIAGPWTPVGDPISSTPPTSIYAGTAPLEIAPQAVAGVPPMRGIVHRAEVRSGINGTLVAAPDVRALPAGTTGWTDSAGRTWTLGSAARLDDRAYRFIGEVSSWPARWDVSGEDVWVPVEAAGTTRRLGQGRKALESTLRRRIPSAPSLLAYWPMEESDTADTLAYSPVTGVEPLRLAGADWAADDTLGGSAPLPAVKAGATLSVRVPPTTVTGWQAELVYHLPTLPPVQTEVLRLGITGAAMRTVILYASVSAIRLEVLDADGTVIGAFDLATAGSLAAFAGKWNRLAIYSGDFGGGSTLINATWRDVTTNVRYYLSTAPVTGQGRIATVSATWGADLEGMALGHLSIFTTPGNGVLSSPPSTTIYEGADDGFLGESALARIARLGAEEVATVDLAGRGSDYPDRSTRLGPQRPDTLLNLLEEIQEADGGILYERRDRTGLVYRDRRTLYNQPVALALDYNARGEVPPPLEPVEDDQRLRNDITITRDGGTSARSVVTTGPLSVQPPPAGVGPYDEALTLSLYDDDQPAPIAQWRTHLGTWDEARYPTISVWLHAAPHLIDDVLAMDIGDRVQISNPPPFLPPDTIDQHVLGYTETLGQFVWTLEMNCAPAGPWQVGVVEDPVLGRADTDGSELAGTVAATDIVLPVTVTAGPSWVTAAPNALADPGFESGTGAWACTRGASIGVVSHETGIVHSGAGALRVTRVHPTDTGTLNLWDPTAILAAAAGQTWAGGAWVYSGGASANNMRVAIVWRDSGGAETFVYGTAPSVSAGTWTYLSVSATLPAGAVGVRLGVEGRSTWTVGEWWIADDVRLARTDTHLAADMGDQFPFDCSVGGEVVTVHSIGPSTAPTVADTFTRAVVAPTVADAFGRTVAGGWGSADTGQPWTTSGGTSADYSVGSGVGTASAGVVNSSRFTQLPGLALADVDMQADITVPVVATGASISTGLRLRAAGTSDYYYVEVVRATSGDISLLLVSRVGGSSTTIAPAVSKGSYAAGQTWTVRARLVGSVLQAKLWATAGSEPSAWDVQAYTTSIPAAGPVGTRTILSGGNTNSLPVVVTWDNIRVTAVDSGWGTSTSGHTWTRSGGTASEYTVDGGRGLIALTSADSSRRIITGPNLADTDIRAAMTVPVVAATDSIDMALMSRYQDSGTYYHAVLHCHADATIDVRIRKVVGGTYTTLSISSLLPGTYAAGDTYWIRLQTTGTSLQARGWKDGTAEPGTWQATATDSSITAAGQTGVRMNLQVNNTNTLPVIIATDQYEVSGPTPFHVTRSANGITKGHPAGTDLSLTHPMRAAL